MIPSRPELGKSRKYIALALIFFMDLLPFLEKICLHAHEGGMWDRL